MKEKYLEMESIAKRLEELREELYQSKEHQEFQGAKDAQYIDEEMSHIQSKLKALSEYCMFLY